MTQIPEEHDVGDFAELKKYARKTYGMHQAAVMKTVAEAGLMSHEICQAVEAGICGTLVTYWVKDVLSDRRNSLFLPPPRQGEGISPDTFKERTHLRHVIVGGVCMSDHVRYQKTVRGGDGRAALLILSPEGLSTKQKSDVESFSTLLGFNFKPGAAYYVSLRCTEARHAIGIYGTHGGGFTFFDPNAGEYEVDGFLFDRFLSAYKTIVEKQLGFGTINGVVISRGKLN